MLIINCSDENNSSLISVAISDNLDLRDLCSSYEGVIQVFIINTDIGENELAESLSKMKLVQLIGLRQSHISTNQMILNL